MIDRIQDSEGVTIFNNEMRECIDCDQISYLSENYPNNQIRIFNRWGVSVYETKGYQNDWNGSNYNSSGSTSSNLPVGTYFYLLDLNGDGSNVKKGYVYLTRMNNE